MRKRVVNGGGCEDSETQRAEEHRLEKAWSLCRFSEEVGWHRIQNASGGMGLRQEKEQVLSCSLVQILYTQAQCLESGRWTDSIRWLQISASCYGLRVWDAHEGFVREGQICTLWPIITETSRMWPCSLENLQRWSQWLILVPNGSIFSSKAFSCKGTGIEMSPTESVISPEQTSPCVENISCWPSKSIVTYF